jgi:hypothetical protein
MIKSLDNGIYNRVAIGNHSFSTVVTFDPNANGEVRRTIINTLNDFYTNSISATTLINAFERMQEKYGYGLFRTDLYRGE